MGQGRRGRNEGYTEEREGKGREGGEEGRRRKMTWPSPIKIPGSATVLN
jgi:hypothetical protein